MASRSLLFTLPSFEPAVRIGSCWFERVLANAEANGYGYEALRGGSCVRGLFDEALARNEGCLLTGVGHGNATTYTGENYAVLIEERDNADCLVGRPWYALSCTVGLSLGKAVVEYGCPAFIGYDDTFTFIADEGDPCGGVPARGFMEASNEVVNTLIAGGDFNEAYARSQALFDYWYDQETDPDIQKWLNWDKIHQVGPPTSREYGDGTTVITDAPPPDKVIRIDIEMDEDVPEEGWMVHGAVTDRRKGEPLPDVEMTLAGMHDVTDSGGVYFFEDVPDGDHTLLASKAGYKDVNIRVTIPPAS